MRSSICNFQEVLAYYPPFRYFLAVRRFFKDHFDRGAYRDNRPICDTSQRGEPAHERYVPDKLLVESGCAGYAHTYYPIISTVQRAYTARISNGEINTDVLGKEFIAVMVVQEVSFVCTISQQTPQPRVQALLSNEYGNPPIKVPLDLDFPLLG